MAAIVNDYVVYDEFDDDDDDVDKHTYYRLKHLKLTNK